MTGKLAGKVAIVTGAGAGIGRASSMLFAQEGATIIAVDRDGNSNGQLVHEISAFGGVALGICADVSSSNDVRSVVDRTLSTYGHIDILFNNAGVVSQGLLHTLEDEEWDRILSVNLKSVFLFCRAVIPSFLGSGSGVILNTASSTALRAVGDRALYSATKGAIVALTRSMALDYAQDNIRVNCICPGTTDTPSLRGRLHAKGNYEAARAEFIARQPLRRLGRPEEIAQAALYLVSEDSSFVTGAAFQIDGGMSL